MTISTIPTTIRRAVRPGESVIQNFTVNGLPNGSIVAAIDGGRPFIRLRSLAASERIRVRLTDDEFHGAAAGPPR